MAEIENWLVTVLGALDADTDEDFAGLGLLFYKDRETLPVHRLVQSDCELALPTKSVRESIRLLARITKRNSDFHDGFHLVDTDTFYITDVSQFLSPPVPPIPLTIEGVSGARHMAARLASLLPEVELTAVYTQDGEATLYKNGRPEIVRISAFPKCDLDESE